MIRLCLLSLLLLPLSAKATPVVADLSNYHIDIDARFIGTRLFLFGTREEGGDVIVAVRGPERTFTVRKKDHIGGMWVHRSHATFEHVPTFYTLISSKPKDTLPHVRMLQALALENQEFGTLTDASSRTLNAKQYSAALRQHLTQKGLYRPPSTLQFMGETLFKATLEFPSTLPKGAYTAEIYLIRDDRLIGMHTLPIAVRNVGLEATIADLAHEQPVLYGLLSILLALSAGWFANRLFSRR